jgi:hypothetical protein
MFITSEPINVVSEEDGTFQHIVCFCRGEPAERLVHDLGLGPASESFTAAFSASWSRLSVALKPLHLRQRIEFDLLVNRREHDVAVNGREV